MERIRTGDRVVVTTGPEKGNQGDVLAVNKQKNTALVSGVRRVKKHTKPSQDNPGGIVEKESPIQLSNISLIDPESNKPTRIGFKTLDSGEKVRFAKRSGATIENP